MLKTESFNNFKLKDNYKKSKMNENQKKQPFRVMKDPRGFIRRVLLEKQPLHWVLAFLVGAVWLFSKAYTYILGFKYSVVTITLGSLLLAIPVGFVLIYLTSYLLYITGKVFKGQGTYPEITEAYAWSRVPELFVLLSWLIMVGLYGQKMFTPILTTGAVPILVFGLLLIQIVFWLWQSVILFHTLGEVQKFSAWVAIWNVLLAWLILVVLDNSLDWVVIKGLNLRPMAVRFLQF